MSDDQRQYGSTEMSGQSQAQFGDQNTTTTNDERIFQGIEVSGSATANFGDQVTNNSIVSRDFIINILDQQISQRIPGMITPGIQRSHTADQKGSALLVAASQGRVDVVQQILEDGANWMFTEIDEQTALFKAVSAGSPDVVELLLSSKERQSYLINHAERQYLDTPLHRAAVQGKTEIVRKLLSCHAPIEATQRDGITPIQLAAGQGYLEIVKMLLDKGANIYHENNNRGTILHMASRKGRLGIVRLLVNQDSSPSYLERRNRPGDTALFLAVLHKHVDCARCLIQCGASVHAANNDHANILHIACGNGMPVFLEEQLPKFSIEEIRAKNRMGHTPLDIAIERRKDRCVDILKARLADGR